MNDQPDSEFIKELQKEFQIISNPKQLTFPASKPKVTIDYIVSLKRNMNGFTVKSTEIVNEPVASDHRPVIVELRMGK